MWSSMKEQPGTPWAPSESPGAKAEVEKIRAAANRHALSSGEEGWGIQGDLI